MSLYCTLLFLQWLEHLQFLAKAIYLPVIQPSVISTMVKLFHGSSGTNLQILSAPPFLVHFLLFYNVRGMM